MGRNPLHKNMRACEECIFHMIATPTTILTYCVWSDASQPCVCNSFPCMKAHEAYTSLMPISQMRKEQQGQQIQGNSRIEVVPLVG